MAIYKAAISFPADSDFPRDRVVMTPHFNGSDAQALAAALKTNLIANPQVGNYPFEVKIYDAQKTPPSYPLATASQAGTPPASPAPREISLCLSFYGQFNRPRQRGRVYVPCHLIGAPHGLRPTAAQQGHAASFATTFSNALPSGTFWTVYSKRAQGDFQVTNWYVDDEWDIQRRRGLKAETRITGTA
jgi:hypothetical protein